MEKRVTKKIEIHQVDFKNEIKKWFEESDCKIISKTHNDIVIDKTNDFLTFMYDYNSLSLSKEDFQKRTRIKNVVPNFNRCIAKRANGDQCTRRKNENSKLCGTHNKGSPHGLFVDEDFNEEESKEMNVQVWVEDIKGINYYIDANNNVYSSEDIYSNKKNPKVISKWKKEGSSYIII